MFAITNTLDSFIERVAGIMRKLRAPLAFGGRFEVVGTTTSRKSAVHPIYSSGRRKTLRL